MGLLSAGGGDDRLQIQLAVWGIIIGIVVSAMLPIMLPSSPTGYGLEEIYRERATLELYTGQSMINQAPFKLVHVYTPYTLGEEYRLTEEGWLYGSELTDGEGNPSYVLDGTDYIQSDSTVIRLDPAQKSAVPLYTTTTERIVMVDPFAEKGGFWWDTVAGGIARFLSGLTGESILMERVKTYTTWSYTGYAYELDPMLRINTENGTSTKTVDDAKLTNVWYNLKGQEGISGGLVLYNSKTNAIIANYTAAEIVSNYDTMSQTASSYPLTFNGTNVNMHIRFDADVLINNLDLSQAWTTGQWSISFTASSADTFLDIANSTSFTSSLGSILTTYLDIMTVNLPNVSLEWNLVLWIICIMPLGLAIILFLSRFGLAGLGAGILGTVLMGGIML